MSAGGARPVLAVIPARGGSKGLPGKNVRPLAGIPLIAHSIRCASLSPSVDRAVVSTDSEEIARVAREHGGDVPFLRPAELATDTAAMWPVLQHALREMERIDGRRFGSLLLLDPTSPGRMPDDVEAAVAALDADPQCDGVVGVSEPNLNPIWHAVVDDGGYMRDLIPEARRFERRQDVPTVYQINGTLYLWRRDFVLGVSDWRSGRLRMRVVPDRNALHIDSADEFAHAELLVRSGAVRLPWLS